MTSSSRYMSRALCAILFCVQFAFTFAAHADECKVPTAQKQAEVATYVSKRYHVASSDSLGLIESGQVGTSCFWRFHFQTGQKRDIVLFLSPDRLYLTSSLFDLQLDPLVEEQTHAELLEKTLLSGNPPTLGPIDAKVTIVEFSDFECPYCKRMKDMLDSEIKASNAPDIRVVYRYFPLAMHPWAKSAAQMAACVESIKPAEFWKIQEFFFDNQRSFTVDNIHDKAVEFVSSGTTVDPAQFQACAANRLASNLVEQDESLGDRLSVHATPTIFINGFRIQSVRDGVQLHTLVEAARNNQNPSAITLSASGPVTVQAAGSSAQCVPSARTTSLAK